MCGNYCKPCLKYGVKARGDNFSISECGRLIYINNTRFFRGDVDLNVHMPNVFIQITSHHRIDKYIVMWCANLNREKRHWILDYIREGLKNDRIPASTVANRCRRLHLRGQLTSEYYTSSNFGLTDEGWRTFIQAAKVIT